jgi:hypothetical protein
MLREEIGAIWLLATEPDVLAGGIALLALCELAVVGDHDSVGVLGIDRLVVVIGEKPAVRVSAGWGAEEVPVAAAAGEEDP